MAGMRGAYRAVGVAYPPPSVPHRQVLWCLHCEQVFRSVDALSCPSCGAGLGDIWSYHDSANGFPREHWPAEAPEDGTYLPLYQGR